MQGGDGRRRTTPTQSESARKAAAAAAEASGWSAAEQTKHWPQQSENAGGPAVAFFGREISGKPLTRSSPAGNVSQIHADYE